jgi:hypothetical protein
MDNGIYCLSLALKLYERKTTKLWMQDVGGQ